MEKQKNTGHFDWFGYIAILAITGIFLYLLFYFFIPPLYPYAPYPLYVVLGVGGTLLVADLLRKLVSLDFGSDLLAGMSIVTSVFLDQYLAGSLVVLMLSGGQTLENYALRTASKVLDALAKRAPTTAHKKVEGELEDVSVGKIEIGDIIEIYPHEICPVDGVVVEGNGIMDESFLTGEPFMINKATGSEVLSGAINGDASLTIKATKLSSDSRYEKIMQVMIETEQKRPHMRRLADQLGAWYTPLAVFIAVIAWLVSGESIRFLAVLVIATPCPLLIAIPVAIIGSISLCASRGILIKNPVVLEQIDLCETMIFDKTGTLTYGKPVLVEQKCYGSNDPREVLRLVASVERYSKHPLAGAILAEAKKEQLKFEETKEISEVKGKGIEGLVGRNRVQITSRKQVEKLGLDVSLPKGGGLECVAVIDGSVASYYRFRDAPRSDSSSFVGHLHPMHGINKVMIVSGDRAEEVKYLADSIGVSEVYASQSPEEKVEIVERETKTAKTVYLGDGINDAPALVAASVGVAFGQNSDITAEAAGAVVLDNSLVKVDEFLHISRRMRKIALQSALGGMSLSVVGMIIASLGLLPPVAGAITQEVIDVIVILNALRTIKKPKMLTDIPHSS